MKISKDYLDIIDPIGSNCAAIISVILLVGHPMMAIYFIALAIWLKL